MTADGLPADRRDRIIVAVETIEESLGILTKRSRLGRSEFKQDSTARDVVERRFVKMTEASIDIAKEIVKQETGGVSESNPASMRALESLDVLSASTADEMAQAARFRNVLAHTYGDVIDPDVVYNSLQDLERY